MFENTSKNEEGYQFLSFFLKNERFAINVTHVKEIIEYTQITCVPMMQNFLAGVTNIRGNVIPVIDLSSRLGMGMSEICKKSCIITVEIELEADKSEIGLVVDMVDQVYDINTEHKMQAPEFGTKIRKEFMQMMARIEDRFITILDIYGVLELSEIAKVKQKATYKEGHK